MSRKPKQRYTGERVLDGKTYRVFRVEPGPEHEAVAARTHPRQNSFDQSYMKGRFPMWIRHVGGRSVMYDEDTSQHESPAKRATRRGEEGHTYGEDGSAEPRPIGYNRPRAEEPYVQSLHEFFADRIALWPGTAKQKEWLRIVMLDTRSTRDIGEDLDVSHAAVVLGRQRAVESFVKFMGGKAALAEKLREYMHAKEVSDGKERLKFLPRWVHG